MRLGIGRQGRCGCDAEAGAKGAVGEGDHPSRSAKAGFSQRGELGVAVIDIECVLLIDGHCTFVDGDGQHR